MITQRVRIGIVGAGSNTRLRHIPGFRQIPGVDLLGVVNRTPGVVGPRRQGIRDSRASIPIGGR